MQDDIVQKAVNGHSLLILGQSGTGKSFVCKEIARKLKEKCINVRLTATTGIASLNIGGQTVHSWDTGEKVWVTYKNQNAQSIHGELESQGQSSDGIPYVTGSDGFSVQQITKKSITVSYTGDSVSYSQQFVAPQVTFSTVHNSRKSVISLDVSTGGLGVSSDTEGKLKIWQSSDGEVRRELVGHKADVYTCRFFPSGVVVLSGGADMQLKVWSAETGQCAATMVGHRAGISDASIVERGRNVVSCSRDGTAKLWDVGQQSCLGTISECGGVLNSCAIGVPENRAMVDDPDTTPSEREVLTEGKLLLLGCENSNLLAYGLQSRKKIFDVPCHGAVNCCCFLSDISAVCGTEDGHLTVIDLRNPRVPLKEWKESRSAILSVCPYNRGFWSSSGDGTCFYVNEQCDTIVELTGADCDPLYKVVLSDTHVFTSCRDGNIRKYNLTSTRL